MQLVILAAGHGRRFGGLKQLAPVGPDGDALMDFTVRTAQACGFAGIVLIVRAEIEDEIAAHVEQFWPRDLEVVFVRQLPRPGTAQAVASAAGAIAGPFGVANADDLYGHDALERLRAHFDPAHTPDAAVRQRHALVAYRLERTIIGDDTVRRGLCMLDVDGRLEAIAEHEVRRTGEAFEGTALADSSGAPHTIDPGALVSMNLWGFHPRMLDHLAGALEDNAYDGDGTELLLPDVVSGLLASGADAVQVHPTEARCVGMTHRADLGVVRAEIAGALRADREPSAG